LIKPANWPGRHELRNDSASTPSCAPARYYYPTDLKLLNEGEDGTEKIIDDLLTSQSTWFLGTPSPPLTTREKKLVFSFLSRSPREKKPRPERKLKAASEEAAQLSAGAILRLSTL